METKHKEFKPFDKVIFKYKNKSYMWVCGLFSNYEDGDVYLIGNDVAFSLDEYDILPFEGNEHLVGTTSESEEEVNLKGGERIICSDDVKLLMSGVGFLTTFSYIDENIFYTGKSRLVVADYNYAIKFTDFNPYDMEETKKHVLCVKNGKIVKYKG